MKHKKTKENDIINPRSNFQKYLILDSWTIFERSSGVPSRGVPWVILGEIPEEISKETIGKITPWIFQGISGRTREIL